MPPSRAEAEELKLNEGREREDDRLPSCPFGPDLSWRVDVFEGDESFEVGRVGGQSSSEGGWKESRADGDRRRKNEEEEGGKEDGSLDFESRGRLPGLREKGHLGEVPLLLLSRASGGWKHKKRWKATRSKGRLSRAQLALGPCESRALRSNT